MRSYQKDFERQLEDAGPRLRIALVGLILMVIGLVAARLSRPDTHHELPPPSISTTP